MALALVAPASARAAEIREQPVDTERGEITRVEWTAAAPDAVVVERRFGLWWVEASELTAVDEGDGTWSTRWQPGRDAPSGTHRIRIEADGASLVSDEFEVRPCECVLANRLRWRWRDGRFRVRLTAEYAPAGYGDFKLPATAVRTGRPVARVLLDGRRIGSVRLRFRRGAFRGSWSGPQRPRASVVFRLVSLTDGFGNS